MPPEAPRDYEVGYGKPPRHTRFRKGQSGNPRGRPSGSKNLKPLLNEALNERVVMTEEGGRRNITKREAIVTQLVNRSATADLRPQDPARHSSRHRRPRRAGFSRDLRFLCRRRKGDRTAEGAFFDSGYRIIENLTRTQYDALLRQDFTTFAARCFHELNPQTDWR